jgi:hypothetical protein
MKQLSFETLVASVLAAFALVAIVLVFLNLSSNPRVRSFQLRGETESADLLNQAVRIRFNRPMETVQLSEELIDIEPEADYIGNWIGSDLSISFQEPLVANQKYTITLADDFTDIYGTSFAEEQVVEFSTREQTLALLQRNEDYDDEIIAVSSELSNPESLYKSWEISSFDKLGNKLAVISIAEAERRELRIVDLDEESVTTPFSVQYDVSQAIFSRQSPEIYLLRQQVSIQNGFVVPETGRKLYSYNYQTDVLQEISTGDQVTDISDFDVAPNEAAIIIRDGVNEFYYLLNPKQPGEVISLGRYLDSGGFNLEGDKISFVNIEVGNVLAEPYILTVDSELNENELTSGDIYAIDPHFIGSEDNIVYAGKARVVEGARGISEIRIMDREGFVVSELQYEDFSLELPQPSTDNRLIAIEGYTLVDLRDFRSQRNLGYQSKPNQAKILIYDTLNEEFIDNGVRGTDVVWD